MSKSFEITVPASTANLGPAFDTIGMAFQLYLKVRISRAQETSISYVSPGHEDIPVDKKNLIYEMLAWVFEKAGKDVPHVHLEVENDIPLTRGLGSSASAIVAGLFAGNALLDNFFSTEELYLMATQIEDHPDNVGASIYGGIVVGSWDGKEVHHIRLDPPKNLRIMAITPEFTLPTAKARQALPDHYSRRDVVYNISHSALLVASLMSEDLAKLKIALKDRVHQQYRASLVPGMADMIASIQDHGAYGAVLSGAGPTLLALSDAKGLQQVEAYMADYFKQQPYAFDLRELLIDVEGVCVETLKQVNA